MDQKKQGQQSEEFEDQQPPADQGDEVTNRELDQDMDEQDELDELDRGTTRDQSER
jgi:hypothetical protein